MRFRVVVVVAAAFACNRSKSKPPPPPPAIADAPVEIDPVAHAAPDAAPAPEPLPLPPQIPEAPPRRLWTDKLSSEDDFLAYSKELGGERFTKFVIDLKTDAIYYFDVDVYRVHKDFIFAELYKKPRTKENVRIFDRNYGSKKTEFMMCYLVHHLASDQWTFAFWEGDIVLPEHVEHAYKRMRETFYLGDKVRYRPDSTYQEQVALQLRGVPVITNDKLYKSAEYQAFNEGKAIGVLRLVPPGASEADLTFDPGEIVILPESLPDITPVAGIISETFSTPLAHVSLRARAWGIPNVGLKGATARYKDLAGKTVYFEATDAGHTLREATPDEIAAWKARAQAAEKVFLPAADLTATDLRTLDHLRAKDVTAYGTKASNLGEIVFNHPTAFLVPAGFGVPITYYDQHLKANGLDVKLAKLLGDDKFRHDPAYRKQALEGIRNQIMAAPIDPAFEAKLATALHDLTGGKEDDVGVFVRSSTNAEDLPGFSGAGLYDTLPNVKGTHAVADAIKAVWASVWNLRAYEEREHYHIDHMAVFGAVLVQIGIDGTAAGVLVTAHPTDPMEKTTYTINAKSGLGLRVVEGKKVPESLLYDYHNHGLRVLSRSDEDTMLVFDAKGGVREVPNPQKGKPILSNARAIQLGSAAYAITKMFPPDRPLDIEWVFAGDQLYIVQTRPYVVR